MSFSYKTLNSNDVTLTSYIANKPWEINSSSLFENGIRVFIGENVPVSRTSPYDPINDIETSNGESRRLIFDSIKHLYYQNYIPSASLSSSIEYEDPEAFNIITQNDDNLVFQDGSNFSYNNFIDNFYPPSSYLNYEQSTLASGSDVSTFRNISTLEGNYYNLDTGVNYTTGSKIAVISINQEIYGSGLYPNSVFISGSDYYLRDDGEGNLFNYINESNYSSSIYNIDAYLELLNSNNPQLEYVGNIFYSQGLIVITNKDYICVFGAPPSAVNDYYVSSNMITPQTYAPLINDFSDCTSIDPNSFISSPAPGYIFPDYTYSSGSLNITPNQTSVIPGKYQIEYTIQNQSGMVSNTGSINLNITSEPLQLTNIISASSCYGVATPLPVTFSINYGVPYYSYSLDNGSTYTGVNNLFNVTVSGSMIPSSASFIYVKDYLGETLITPISLWQPIISYTASMSQANCSGSSVGKILVTGDTGLYSSLNNSTYFSVPNTFTNLSSSTYTIYVKNLLGCITSSSVIVSDAPAISLVPTLQHVKCYGSATGNISLSVINPSTNYSITWRNSLNTIIGNSLILNNISTGSYTVSIVDNVVDGCQTISASYSITGSSLITLSSTASYIDSCSSAIIINAQGGVSPYTYYALNNTNQTSYNSSTSNIPLNSLGLNSGSFSTYVVDSLGCTSTTSSLEIFSRGYIYSGSTCEQT